DAARWPRWPPPEAAPAATPPARVAPPRRRRGRASKPRRGYGEMAAPPCGDHRQAWRPVQGGQLFMMSWRGRLLAVLIAVALAQGAWIVYPWVRDFLFPPEETPAARGHQVAVELGCFACHGPGGGGGVHNPGSKEGEVPAFTEQTQMMYVKSTDDLREYVLDGAPKRRRDDADYVAKMEKAGLHMPAYRGFLNDAELEDLVA